MRRGFAILALAVLSACGKPAATPADETLAQARANFVSNTASGTVGGGPVDVPPPEVFRLVRYPTPLGQMDAYLTPPPKDGPVRRPAIIWMTGGDSNSINDLWTPEPVSNDQTAHAFRDAGMVMMFPSLRGGNLNPGHREGFYGEVNDVLSAADYLAALPYVDPARIYLGGHSTGGTLVLLTGEYSGRFRAVFAFGPVSHAISYNGQFLPPGMTDPRELKLRSPVEWLTSIRSPVFVFEGDQKPSNQAAVERMRSENTNPLAHFYLVHGASHFSILAPTTALVARKILADTGPTSNIDFTAEELNGLTFETPPPNPDP
ncbi:MAG TPA: prolyl oligopeptidase family serine peptidase [Caulobacteraceae bacterium]